MKTGDIQLIITLDAECKKVKFRSYEVDGVRPTDDQSIFGAVFYAAISHIVSDEDIFQFYLELAKVIAKDSGGKADQKKKPYLKVVH